MSKLSSAKAVDTIQRITLYKVVLQLLQHFISYFHVKTIRINGLIIQLSNTSFRLMLFYFLVYDMGSQILYVNTNMKIFLIRGWVWLTSPVYVLTIVTKHQQSELVWRKMTLVEGGADIYKTFLSNLYLTSKNKFNQPLF